MIPARLKVLWLGAWSTLRGRSEEQHQELVAQGAALRHRGHLARVREALTSLIFQNKKLGDQLQALDGELLELKADVQTAARQDKDELALELIARLETVQGEHAFLKEQTAVLDRDIVVARETEKKLVGDLAQAEQLVGALASRYQPLRVRRQLRQELRHEVQGLTQAAALPLPLTDQIHRLEAETEVLKERRESWQKDWQKLRDDRRRHGHQRVLDQIKEGLRRPQVPAVAAPSMGG